MYHRLTRAGARVVGLGGWERFWSGLERMWSTERRQEVARNAGPPLLPNPLQTHLVESRPSHFPIPGPVWQKAGPGSEVVEREGAVLKPPPHWGRPGWGWICPRLRDGGLSSFYPTPTRGVCPRKGVQLPRLLLPSSQPPGLAVLRGWMA